MKVQHRERKVLNLTEEKFFQLLEHKRSQLSKCIASGSPQTMEIVAVVQKLVFFGESQGLL